MAADFRVARLYLDWLNAHARTKCEAFCHPSNATIANLYEVLRQAQMKQDSDDVARFAAEAVAVLRAYRGRIHRADEDEEGTFSAFHTVYGVHSDLMAAADAVITTAREVGLLEVARREYL